MKINYKLFVESSDENKKRIFKFITLFRDLIEMHNDKIPFSALAGRIRIYDWIDTSFFNFFGYL